MFKNSRIFLIAGGLIVGMGLVVGVFFLLPNRPCLPGIPCRDNPQFDCIEGVNCPQDIAMDACFTPCDPLVGPECPAGLTCLSGHCVDGTICDGCGSVCETSVDCPTGLDCRSPSDGEIERGITNNRCWNIVICQQGVDTIAVGDGTCGALCNPLDSNCGDGFECGWDRFGTNTWVCMNDTTCSPPSLESRIAFFDIYGTTCFPETITRSCGDGICGPCETGLTCAEDCMGRTEPASCDVATCGDGVCSVQCGEDEISCRDDCTATASFELESETDANTSVDGSPTGSSDEPSNSSCGDGFCDLVNGETPFTCDQDCNIDALPIPACNVNTTCGDGICDFRCETPNNCASDCTNVEIGGNGTCGAGCGSSIDCADEFSCFEGVCWNPSICETAPVEEPQDNDTDDDDDDGGGGGNNNPNSEPNNNGNNGNTDGNADANSGN